MNETLGNLENLRREMDHPADAGAGLRQGAAIGDVEAQRCKIRLAGEFGQPRFLERDIVIIIEIIDADHALAPPEKCCAYVIADEAGRAGDKYRHMPN